MGRFELVEYSPFYTLRETASVFAAPRVLVSNPFFQSSAIVDELDYALDLLSFPSKRSVLVDDFETITDLIRIDETPFHRTTLRVGARRFAAPEDLYLRALSDRVSALELGFDRLVLAEEKPLDRKYTWTAEFKGPEKERKYKLAREIKDGKKGNVKWTAEIKGKSAGGLPIEHTYTVELTEGKSSKEKKKVDKSKEKGKAVASTSTARLIEIEEPSRHGAIVLRKAFVKRRGTVKELSLQDSAALIQRTFRAYLIRRSQALRALRELAIAKNKLKEIRSFFNNFTYRRRLVKDAEERQRFSEKIIVLLLTVDAIEGADLMVRAAKKSMVDELETILDIVDPQPTGKYLSVRRRTFNMPDPTINKELAAGVAEVVHMLEEEAS